MMERNISSSGETLNRLIETQRTSRKQVRNERRYSAKWSPIKHRYKSSHRSRSPHRRHHNHRQRSESPISFATSQSNIDDAEAVTRMCFVKEVFIQISQNIHENIWPEACNFIKKQTLKQVFSCEFCEIFKNTFLYRIPLVATSDSGSESELVYHNPPVVTENQRFLISSEVREASSNDKDQGVDEETGDIFSEINSNNLVLTNTSPVISGQLAEVAKQCREEGLEIRDDK